MMKDANEILNLAAERYGEALYWHIRRIVVAHDDAEDALQETFIKIFTKADGFKGDESSLKPWFYRIATNEALQVLRKKTHLFQSLDSLSGELTETLTAEAPADALGSAVLFQKATLRLGTAQRTAFYLRYYDGLSYREIADITGKSENSLRANYHYATEKIKEYLKENAI